MPSKWTKTCSASKYISATDAARAEQHEGFKKLLESGKGSDLTITCCGQTFNVHTAILGSRSDFFATACWGGFKESHTRYIDLPEDNPNAVSKMLQYLYLNDYSARSGSEDDSLPDTIVAELLVDAQVYSLGKKYGIKGLRKAAAAEFEADMFITCCLDTSSANVDAFAAMLEVVYTITLESDKDIRKSASSVDGRLLEQMLGNATFKDLLARTPEIAYDLLVSHVAVSK